MADNYTNPFGSCPNQSGPPGDGCPACAWELGWEAGSDAHAEIDDPSNPVEAAISKRVAELYAGRKIGEEIRWRDIRG